MIRTTPRALAEEVAVALSYDGATQAVMMATPADLEDFARGFTLTEGIAEPHEIDAVEVAHTPLGIDLRIWLRGGASGRLMARRRSMLGPVGCGLCGIDSLEQAVRTPLPVPEGGLRVTRGQIAAAMARMQAMQPLHAATRATHAAGFWQVASDILTVREDVGRHNALDKLAGAVSSGAGGSGAGGVVLMTSRLSIDLVQKCAALGAPIIVAASAPTAAAVAMADAAGITLVARARGAAADVLTHPGRLAGADNDA